MALLKAGDQVRATDAVSLIDSGVGTVCFANRIRLDGLPVDFTVAIDIYAMVNTLCFAVISCNIVILALDVLCKVLCRSWSSN